MEFLKKHYEKMILSVVLLGLAGAAVLLPIMVSSVEEFLTSTTQGFKSVKPKEWKPIDLTTNQAVLARLARPGDIRLSGEHNLFNPVKWDKEPSGLMRKRSSLGKGPESVLMTAVNPLYLIITFDGLSGAVENQRFSFGVTREAAVKISDRRKSTRLAKVGEKNEVFILKEIQGRPDNPTGAVLELLDNRETQVVTKENPIKVVAGFSANLRYEAESKNYDNSRKGDKIVLSGVSYNIVAISETEVLLSNEKTGQRTPVKLNAAAR